MSATNPMSSDSGIGPTLTERIVAGPSPLGSQTLLDDPGAEHRYGLWVKGPDLWVMGALWVSSVGLEPSRHVPPCPALRGRCHARSEPLRVGTSVMSPLL